MTQFFEIHPDNPQQRLIHDVVEILQQGGIIVYPTDSAYALGCQIGNKEALARIRAIRKLDKDHNFTLVCRDLSELSTYAKVSNSVYKLLKANTPGPYTFILQATRDVPKMLQHPKRKTIGLRVPQNNIAMALLEELGEPLMSVSLIMPEDDLPLVDSEDMCDKLEKQVDLIIDGGSCGLEMTTVVDCIADVPVVVRLGKGDVTPFL